MPEWETIDAINFLSDCSPSEYQQFSPTGKSGMVCRLSSSNLINVNL